MTRKPLLLAFVAGGALVVCIRMLWPGLGGAIAAAIVAVAVVWTLGIYYWQGEVLRRDRAGDDLYYLGLLLTLVSLIYALVALFLLGDDGDVQVRVNTLIGNFGIALLSTVAGILGRILLQDSSEGELAAGMAAETQQGARDARREQAPLLTDEMREAAAHMLELRRTLREAADAFAHFTRVTLSHADHIKSHTEQLLQDFNQHMAAAAKQRLEDTEAVWQNVGSAMRQEGEGLLHGIQETVSGAAARTEETWRSLVGQIESASAASRERLHSDAEEMGQMLARLEAANGSLQSLANAVDGTERRVSTLGEAASGATTSLKANTTALADAVGRQMAEQAQAWKRAVQDFDAAVEVQRERSERANAATQAAIDALVASLGAAEQDVATLGSTAAGAAAGAEARIAELLAALDALANGAKEQQEASLRAWREAASTFSAAAREQLARERDAWRDVLAGFNTGRKRKAPHREYNAPGWPHQTVGRAVEPGEPQLLAHGPNGCHATGRGLSTWHGAGAHGRGSVHSVVVPAAARTVGHGARLGSRARAAGLGAPTAERPAGHVAGGSRTSGRAW